MATRASIEFDYKNALAQADKLDEIASSLDNLSGNKLNTTLQNLSSGWKGDNARAYINKGSKLKSRIDSTAGELHTIASEIREKAKRMYNAEMAALAIAEERNY
jgi:WXG100 family type VII secretion target